MKVTIEMIYGLDTPFVKNYTEKKNLEADLKKRLRKFLQQLPIEIKQENIEIEFQTN
jgi:hypothetical protein